MKNEIERIIGENKVVLFMKGVPHAPQCGFSQSVVGILQGVGVEFTGVDVLASAEMRSGIKAFSDWPTIPQLYIDKEFVGGADIIQEMFKNGELVQMLKERAPSALGEEAKPPKVGVTASAAKAIIEAGEGEDTPYLRMEINDAYSLQQQRDSLSSP